MIQRGMGAQRGEGTCSRSHSLQGTLGLGPRPSCPPFLPQMGRCWRRAAGELGGELAAGSECRTEGEEQPEARAGHWEQEGAALGPLGTAVCPWYVSDYLETCKKGWEKMGQSGCPWEAD